jgi:hypothetical protein
LRLAQIHQESADGETYRENEANYQSLANPRISLCVALSLKFGAVLF